MFEFLIRDVLNRIFLGLYNQLNENTKNITMSPWDAFGQSFWSDLLKIGTSVVMPFSITIMCYFMAAELYHVYCRSNGELDVQLVMTTVLKFIFPFILITKSYDFIKIIFVLFNQLILKMSNQGMVDLYKSGINIDTIMAEVHKKSWWDQAMYYFQLAPIDLGLNLLGIIILVIVYGRLFEMVFYWILSPIPLASLVSHEYSQIGKNFIKMFCAVMLQGALMLMCVILYTLLVEKTVFQPTMDGAWKMLGYAAVLVFSLIKTGSLSKRICGTF